MALKFKFLTGDINWQTYGGKFVSKKLNNGEFDCWLVIEVCNLEDACGRDANVKYCVSLQSVSPSEAGESELASAKRSCGWDEMDLTDDLVKVELLSSYGIYATLWTDSGNNLAKLMKEARRQANASQIFYGFMMDRAQNRLGASGWDFQRGDVYGERFREYAEARADSNEIKTMVSYAADAVQPLGESICDDGTIAIYTEDKEND